MEMMTQDDVGICFVFSNKYVPIIGPLILEIHEKFCGFIMSHILVINVAEF
jgi:hypothetical protein